MTPQQETTLAAALKAETNAGVVAALAIRDDVTLTAWCNGASASDAWNESMGRPDLFDATDVTKFDNLTAGKRDAWRLLLDNAPIDATRAKTRKAIVDTWGNTDSVAVLQACTRKATRAEAYLGGTSTTTNTVTALKLNFTGALSITDVSLALNHNP